MVALRYGWLESPWASLSRVVLSNTPLKNHLYADPGHKSTSPALDNLCHHDPKTPAPHQASRFDGRVGCCNGYEAVRAVRAFQEDELGSHKCHTLHNWLSASLKSSTGRVLS
ncbi:hypothetical protein PM082_004591 [Marasmius tenuissimus]|nr:hypothetical protein PM082_004591 [Marasmius tenuissimus]